ncbi:adenine deaminase [Lactiplantibacillus argentoratensis]|jgi:adenine deaminase|uniref:adenine deaminase n=1 Tax=Lactiplantibacillus argentoratensis TaxID=271881 RepID=UPI0007BB7515|nr:adenine deaminase [Lactiplantibacillus argentoratensis]KZT90955.1 Adenine deaminase [Lactiplantibacillus plantarum]MBP5808905.1 adenine deaminase [Lactiplantibacillus argentoratensis]
MTKTVEMVITGAQVLNVYTREFEATSLWIDHGRIISNLRDEPYIAAQHVDATGQWIVPGMVDAHVHMESSMVAPSELGKVLLQHGVTTIATDPHELANVAGVAGIQYLIDDARQTPLDVCFMLPSSVPCVPFDDNGATLHAADLRPLYQQPEVRGLAEVMDYGAVARGDADILAKISDAYAHGYHADGHAAGLNAHQLNVMRDAGLDTDHECMTVTEALDRIKAGMYVFLREGTVERDILPTIGAVTEANAGRFAFCTDDKTISDLITEGSIDYNVRLAIQSGMRPELAYTLASFNGATAHRLSDRGSLSAGQLADLVVLDNLEQVSVARTMKRGQWVLPSATKPLPFTATRVQHHTQLSDLQLPVATGLANVIGVQPNHIETDHLTQPIAATQNFEADCQRDVLKMVVIERHHNTGKVGVGLVHGFALKHGAIAGTVAHDAHNIVAVGTSDAAILRAVNQITKDNGGIAVVDDEQVLATMPLAIGGLLSAATYTTAAKQLADLKRAYAVISEQPLSFDPFITLSFLTLPVIPTLKLTARGLFDYATFDFIPVAIQDNQRQTVEVQSFGGLD